MATKWIVGSRIKVIKKILCSYTKIINIAIPENITHTSYKPISKKNKSTKEL